jgi:glucose-1-phosphate cytidylyltransferase
MVLEPAIFDYLDGDACVFEQEPMRRLAVEGQLMSYTHRGFWQCMDNIREKEILEKMIAGKKAPWMKWDEA